MITIRHINVLKGVGVVKNFNSSRVVSNLSATALTTSNLATQDQLKYKQLTINPVLSAVFANPLIGARSTTITATNSGNVYSGSIIKSVLHMVGVTASGQNNCVPYAV